MGRTESEPKKSRIVYVDNDSQRQRGTQTLIEIVVRGLPFEVISFYRPEEAQQAMDTPGEPLPTLLLVSVDEFPEEAWAWIEGLKEHDQYKNIPVIVCTSDAAPDAILRQQTLAGVEVIQQLPAHLDLLKERLEALQ